MSELTAEYVLTLFNYAVIAFAFIGALFGFLFGTVKSLYKLGVNLFVFIVGWVLMDAVCKGLFDIDFSAFQWNITIDEFSYDISTARNFVSDILRNYLLSGAGEKISSTVSEAFAIGLVEVVLKFVYWILVFVFSITVFKPIVWIVWKKLRPKEANFYGKMKPKKVTILSRLGGSVIGAFRVVFSMLVVCFVLSGASSLVDTYYSMSSGDEVSVVLLNDSATLVDTSTKKSDPFGLDIPEQYQFIIDALLGYRENTIPGKVFGSIKIGGECLDEYVFDGLLTINVDNEKQDYHVDINLRKELSVVAQVINVITDEDPTFFKSFNVEKLKGLSNATLNQSIALLSQLETVNVVVPVGLEVVIYSDYLLKEETVGADFKELISTVDFDSMYDVSYTNEFANLGFAFMSFKDLIMNVVNPSEGNEISLETLDPSLIVELLDSVSKLESIDTISKIGICYLLSVDEVKDALSSAGIDIRELGLLEIENDPGFRGWNQEFATLGEVVTRFLAFQELGIDLNKISELDEEEIDEVFEHLSGIVTTVAQSALVNNALPVVVNYGIAKIGETNEYAKYLDVSKVTNWSEELEPLLDCASLILQSGIIESIKDSNNIDVFALLDSIDIEEFSETISKSSVFTGSLNGLLGALFSNSDDEIISSLKGFTNEEMTQLGYGWTKDEIKNLLLAFRDIADLLPTGGGSNFDFDKLDEDTIQSLSSHLCYSSSKFVAKNLSVLLKSALTTLEGQMDFNFSGIKYLNTSEWTEEELSGIFHSILDLMSLVEGNAITNIQNMSEEQIDTLATHFGQSAFISQNFPCMLSSVISNTGFVDGISLSSIDYSGTLAEERQADMKDLFTCFKLVLEYKDDFMSLLTDSDVAERLISNQVISNVLIGFIKSECNSTGSSSEFDLSIIREGVNSVGDDEWNDTVSARKTNVEFTLSSGLLKVQNPSSKINFYDIYVGYTKIGSTDKNGEFDLTNAMVSGKITAIPTKDEIVFRERTYGELHKMFSAFAALLGDSESLDFAKVANDLRANMLTMSDSDIDELTTSKVINKTFISLLQSYGSEVLCIRSDLDLNTELKALSKAVKLLFGDVETIDDIQFDFSTILDTIKGLTNDINQDRYAKDNNDKYLDEIGVILSSAIIRDTFAKTLIDYGGLEVPFSSPYDSKWNDSEFNGVKKPGEIRSLLTSIQILFGEDDIDFNSFSFEKLTSLMSSDKSNLETALNGSAIISSTISKYVAETLFGDSMKDYIADPPEGKTKTEYVSDDLWNFLSVLSNLNITSPSDISLSLLEEKGQSPYQAYLFADTLTQSDIITRSLGKMLTNMLKQSNSSISLDATGISAGEWRNSITSDGKYKLGELALLLINIQELKTVSTSDFDLSKPETSIELFKKFNRSKVLSSVASSLIIEKVKETQYADWIENEHMSSAEWEKEIEILLNLTSLDFSLISTNSASDFSTMIKDFSKSRVFGMDGLIDMTGNKLNEIFGKEVFVKPSSNAFGSYRVGLGELITTMDKLEPGAIISTENTLDTTNISDYEAYCKAWETEADNLINAITALNTLNLSSPASIGEFLDYANSTKILAPSINNILYVKLGISADYLALLPGKTYQQKLSYLELLP